jgi:hypothetical protein
LKKAALSDPAQAYTRAEAEQAFVTVAWRRLTDDAIRELLIGTEADVEPWLRKWHVNAPAMRIFANRLLRVIAQYPAARSEPLVERLARRDITGAESEYRHNHRNGETSASG